MSRDGGLRLIFRQRLRKAHWTSIETGLTEGGVPDAHFLFPGGVEGWIEHKKTDGNAVEVRPLQVSWHDRHARYGGRSFFAVRRKGTFLFLFRGSDAAGLKEKGLVCAPPLGYWKGGETAWAWDEIEAILTAGGRAGPDWLPGQF